MKRSGWYGGIVLSPSALLLTVATAFVALCLSSNMSHLICAIAQPHRPPTASRIPASTRLEFNDEEVPVRCGDCFVHADGCVCTRRGARWETRFRDRT